MRDQSLLSTPRVMHLIDSPGPGGAESICVELARGTEAAGTFGISTPVLGSWVERRMKQLELCTRTVSATGRRRIVDRYKTMRAAHCNVLQAHLLGAGTDAAILARMGSIPAVVTFHGPPDFSAQGIRKRIYQKLLRSASVKVVVVSAALSQIASEWLSLPRNDILVIPNGVDLRNIKCVRTWEHRRRLGISDAAIVLGSIGNMRLAKRHDLLVDVVSILRSQGIDAHAIIVGETAEPLLRQIQEQARQSHVSAFVHVAGFQNDVSNWLPDFDLFLSTSDVEGFSLVIVQAMGAEIPIISTRSGGPQEILDEGKYGTLVETGNPGELARAVRELLADRDRMNFVRRDAKRHVLANYNIDLMIHRYTELYRSLVSTL